MVTDLNFLRTNCSDQFDTDLAIDEYIDFDCELSTNQSILIDNHIHEVLGNSADVSSDEDGMEVSEVESMRKPLIKEVRRAIEMLKEFSFYSEFREGIMKLVRKVNQNVKRLEQKTIECHRFFQEN